MTRVAGRSSAIDECRAGRNDGGRLTAPVRTEFSRAARCRAVIRVAVPVAVGPLVIAAAHDSGKFDIDDMFEVMENASRYTGVDDVYSYLIEVRDDIVTFLRSGAKESHERVVSSHYGGQVSVIELLRIMLRHSTHHLCQLYWFMENVLLIRPSALTAEELAGIVTPSELFETR